MSKTYLITGANRGIGLEHAKILCLRPNTKVIVTTRSESKPLSELAASVSNLTVLKLAVDDESSVKKFGEELGKIADLKIDYFISNAAIADSYTKVYETDRQNLIDHWTVNALGPIEVFKVVKPYLAPKNYLIFVSSIAASITGADGFPFYLSSYGSSKLALNYLVKELSVELKDESIVVSLTPGLVATDMGKHGAVEFLKQGIVSDVPPLTPQESAEYQLKVIDNLTPEQNGKFLNFDGTELPW